VVLLKTKALTVYHFLNFIGDFFKLLGISLRFDWRNNNTHLSLLSADRIKTLDFFYSYEKPTIKKYYDFACKIGDLTVLRKFWMRVR
jgi:hypothetical protein